MTDPAPPPVAPAVGDRAAPAVAAQRPGAAGLVAAGILASRIFGVARTAVLARFLGTGDAADALTVAMRVPNLLQNLLGEGVLSASFIPVYAGHIARGEREEAGRVAGAVLAMLAAVTALAVLIGVLIAPVLVDVLVPRFDPAKRDLTVALVRVVFPATGLLVLSAWCLGILNSHGRFLLSYSAPVAWNLAIMAAVVASGGLPQVDVAAAAAWGAFIGSALQAGIQVPSVIREVPRLRLSMARASRGVRTVVRNFVPAFFGRGIVQISAYVDVFLAGLLGTGAVAIFGYAQTIYLLPVSLFGMSVSAAELPAMSASGGEDMDEARAAVLRERLRRGLRRVAYFVLPSAVAFVAFGELIAAALLQGREFTAFDSLVVWLVLAGFSTGLLATTMARLYSSAFYALRDARTPVRFAMLRIGAGTALAILLAFVVAPALEIEPVWRVAALALAAGVAGWLELALLRRTLRSRIGHVPLADSHLRDLLLAAAAAAIAAFAAWWLTGGSGSAMNPVIRAMLVLGPFGAVYLAVTWLLGVEDARGLLRRIRGA